MSINRMLQLTINDLIEYANGKLLAEGCELIHINFDLSADELIHQFTIYMRKRKKELNIK